MNACRECSGSSLVSPNAVQMRSSWSSTERGRVTIDDRDPAERLRNLVRRQGLPVVRRGRLLVFRKAAVDQWLDVRNRSNYAGGRPGACPVNLNRKEKA